MNMIIQTYTINEYLEAMDDNESVDMYIETRCHGVYWCSGRNGFLDLEFEYSGK